MKLCFETLMEELHSVLLETDELESRKQSHACASYVLLSQSRFRREQKNLKFLVSELLKF